MLSPLGHGVPYLGVAPSRGWWHQWSARWPAMATRNCAFRFSPFPSPSYSANLPSERCQNGRGLVTNPLLSTLAIRYQSSWSNWFRIISALTEHVSWMEKLAHIGVWLPPGGLLSIFICRVTNIRNRTKLRSSYNDSIKHLALMHSDEQERVLHAEFQHAALTLALAITNGREYST